MNKYKRIIIKISGEALSGKGGYGVNEVETEKIALQVKTLLENGYQVGLVIGGGNIWRARTNGSVDRSTADYMGMLATVINSLAMQNSLDKLKVPVVVMSAIRVEKVAEPFVLRKALDSLEKGRVVIFAGGTGSPYFTTDTAGALRASEIQADIYLCAKNVDGVYDKDPKLFADACKYESISFMDVIQKQLKAMDITAMTMCMENKIPVLIFDCAGPDSIVKAAEGKKIGTIIQ
ncbi:MAG TPA: UMP kinase [Eubacteriales bacterium]|nr:UMP kinase [Eubacteriales bacterium]